MSVDYVKVQSALRDLEYIRRIVDRNEQANEVTVARQMQSTRAHTVLYVSAALAAAALIALECLSSPTPTDYLFVTHWYENLRYIGVGIIALMLVLVLAFIYLVVWHSAKQQGTSFESYAAQNFSRLAQLSLFTDLLIKFCCLALIIMAARPDWVAPLLLLFMGEYLIQGRFFVLPLKTGLLLGGGAILLGIADALLWYGSLLFALVPFLLCTLLSLWSLRKINDEQ